MNLFEKLIEVRKTVTHLTKEGQNAQYEYATSGQVLKSVRSKMDELSIILVPEIKETKVTEKNYQNNDGKKITKYFTELYMNMTWLDASNPTDKITVPWYAQGVDYEGEKGVGKALTYGEKYFILKFFNIPTDEDDPDENQKRGAEQITDNEYVLDNENRPTKEAYAGWKKTMSKEQIKQKYGYYKKTDTGFDWYSLKKQGAA